MDDDYSMDLTRDALQVHINEVGAAAGDGGWLVAHYVVIAGLYRINADGSTETRPVLTAPTAQPDYVSYGLLSEAPDLLAKASCEDCEDSEPE